MSVFEHGSTTPHIYYIQTARVPGPQNFFLIINAHQVASPCDPVVVSNICTELTGDISCLHQLAIYSCIHICIYVYHHRGSLDLPLDTQLPSEIRQLGVRKAWIWGPDRSVRGLICGVLTVNSNPRSGTCRYLRLPKVRL